MAQNNENLSNFIDQKAWSDFERLEKVIASAADSMEFLSLTAHEAFKGLNFANTLQQLVDLMNKAKVSTDGLGESNTKLKTGIKELNEEQLKSNLSVKERNDLLKLQVQYEAAPVNSIAKMRAEIRLLTAEYNKLDLEKQKDLANNKKLELDAKNATLKGSVDAYTAQKINIGNYPELIIQAEKLKEEMDALANSGQKDSAEFRNLSGQMGTLTSAMGGAAGELTWVVGQMNTLASSSQMDSAEFRKLAIRAAELKEQMASVKTAIGEASANAERGAIAMEKFAETMKEVGKFALAFFGVQAGMEFIAGISEEFEKADKAARQLKNTLSNVDAADQFGKLTEEAEKFSKEFNYLDTYEIQGVFDKLITYGKLTEDQIKEALPVIIDFSAKTGRSLEESTGVITKALEGSAKGLKEFGINIKEAKTATGEALPAAERFGFIMEQLKPRVEGAAMAFKNSWSGEVGGLKKDIRELELAFADFFVMLSGSERRSEEAARSAKLEADAAQKLVNQYEELSKKVNKTADDKRMLNGIVRDLTLRFGDSVTEINAETGALELNLKATKDLISQKLLLANQKAVEYVSKYNAAENSRVENAISLLKAEEQYNDAVKETGITIDQVMHKQQSLGGQSSATMGVGGGGTPLTPDELMIQKLHDNVLKYEQETDKYWKIREELLKKLQEEGFSEEEINKLLIPSKLDPGKKIPPPPGGDKPDKSYIIENEKALSAAMFAQWQENMKMKAKEQKAIADTELESYAVRKEALLEYNRLQAQLNEGAISKEYGDKQFEISNLQKKPKESDESFTQRRKIAQEELLAIELKYNNQVVDDRKENVTSLKALDDSYVAYRLGLLDKYKQAFAIEKADELRRNTIAYDKGLITEEVYQKNIDIITKRYQKAELIANIEYLKQLKKQAKDAGIDTDKIDQALDENENSLRSLPSDKTGKDKSKNPALAAVGLDDESWAKAQKVANSLMDLEGQIVKMVDQRYAREIANLERKKQLIDDNYAAEINAIQGGMISQQKKDVFISQLKAQQMQQDKAINEEIGRQKRKQAQADKVAAISGAIEKGVVAVVNALDTQPVWLGIAMAAIVGATVAAQVATAANTPLPQYGEGTGHLPGGVHAGGDAIVGERNKPEYIFKPGERTAQMVNRATRMSLPRGTRVLTEEQLIRDSVDMLPDAMLYGGGMHGVMEHVMMDGMQDLKGEISQLNDTVKNKQETHFHWDNGELRKSIKRGNDWTDYLNSNFN